VVVLVVCVGRSCYALVVRVRIHTSEVDDVVNAPRLSEFRIAAGHYKTRHHVVLYGGSRCWQVRDETGDEMIEFFPTLRIALSVAMKWDRAIGGTE